MRLRKEYATLSKEFNQQIEKHGKITDQIIAAPDESDIFTWYFIVFNLPDEPYKGGYYMG